jgi:hypothetical protein
MEEVRPEEKEQNRYRRILMQNEDEHNKFEKIAWSWNNRFIASWKTTHNSCEIYIWDTYGKHYKNSSRQKPHIIIYDQKIINLFWSSDNKYLIVVCNNTVYKYRIFGTGKLKQILFKKPSIVIHAATFNPAKNKLAMGIYDFASRSNSVLALDTITKQSIKFQLNHNNIKNKLITSISWHVAKNNILILFANGSKVYVDTRSTQTTLLDSENEMQPFVPYGFENYFDSSSNYFNHSQLKIPQNTYSHFFIESGILEAKPTVSALSRHNLESGKRSIVALKKKNSFAIYLFDVSSNGKLLAYTVNQCNMHKNMETINNNLSALQFSGNEVAANYQAPEIHSKIIIYDLDSQHPVCICTIPNCSIIFNIKISPDSTSIAVSTSNGIYVTTVMPLPSIQELQYREMGISKREQARLKKFRDRYKK